MSCNICEHPQRYDIEQDMLNISKTNTIEMIAEKYGVDSLDLKRHAIEHTQVVTTNNASIAKELKLREADMLLEIAEGYLATFNMMNARIQGLITESQCDDSSVKFERLLTKPVSDTYLGIGSELRQTVKTIADVQQILNGPKNDNVSGLTALAEAIKASRS